MKVILIWSLFLSIWHSLLFWNQEIGVSALLFAMPVVNMAIQVMSEKTRNKKAWLLIIPIILLSSTYCLFDNPIFYQLNKIVIPLLYVIMIVSLNSTSKSIISKIISQIFETFGYFEALLIEMKDEIMTKLKIKKENKRENKDRDFLKSAFFTLVILFIVLGLLASADSEFAKLFINIFEGIEDLNIFTLAVRIGIIILIFFYIASFFINALSEDDWKKENETEDGQSKDSFTLRMMLTALNIVYLVFCYVQIKSLFTIENIKYSSYARQGFFQLMIVSLINITMILNATNKNLKETEKEKKYKKNMCMTMLVFTLIIIISSLTRMNLYQQNYGDTRLRILVNFTLITEIILLIPTAVYILKSNINLLKSYFIIIVSMYCVINFVNIDNIIAKNNIDRYIENGKIDLNYLIKLDSTDTIKQLVRLQETKFKYTGETVYENNMTINQQNTLNTYLFNKKEELEEKETLPEFNYSKWNARKLLEKVRYN